MTVDGRDMADHIPAEWSSPLANAWNYARFIVNRQVAE